MNASQIIGKKVQTTLKAVEREVANRAYRASNELRNSALVVLSGTRSGKRYKVPGTYQRQRDKVSGKMRNGVYYTASAPSEAPALRTGVFRLSWGQQVRVERRGNRYVTIAAIESNVRVGNHLLGELLEKGTKDKKLKPRPYKQAVKDHAMPKINAIYNKPFKI